MEVDRTNRLRLRILRTLLWCTPALRHAVVAGSPDDEGNSVEVVRALASRTRVYWLLNDPPASVRWLIAGAAGADRVRCVPRDSWRAYLVYVTARHVFFTHGLYGSPTPPPHKTIVNLWHGDGPKRRKGFADVRSTVIVAGTRFWGQRRPEFFGMPEHRVLITGNPRVDQFQRPADRRALAALGIAPDRPIVLWLPTYRRTEYRGTRIAAVRNWADADELSRSPAVRAFAGALAEAGRACGVTVVIKPHALDVDQYVGLGLPVLTSGELAAAGTTLYQLLGASCGLVTDYSSVWTDYLCLDRPIGFFCPDLEDYRSDRGLNVDDYESIVPGPLLESPADAWRFVRHCLDEPVPATAHRRKVAELIGPQGVGATARLLTRLGLAPARTTVSRRPDGSARLVRSGRG
jgi:hypothetical protein